MMKLDEKLMEGLRVLRKTVSSEKAIQGLYCNTTIRVYKEVFNAIIQMHTEDITKNYDEARGTTYGGTPCIEKNSIF